MRRDTLIEYRVLLGFSVFFRLFCGCNKGLPGFSRFLFGFDGFMEFYWVLLGFTGFYLVFLALLGLSWVSKGFLENGHG